MKLLIQSKTTRNNLFLRFYLYTDEKFKIFLYFNKILKKRIKRCCISKVFFDYLWILDWLKIRENLFSRFLFFLRNYILPLFQNWDTSQFIKVFLSLFFWMSKNFLKRSKNLFLTNFFYLGCLKGCFYFFSLGIQVFDWIELLFFFLIPRRILVFDVHILSFQSRWYGLVN